MLTVFLYDRAMPYTFVHPSGLLPSVCCFVLLRKADEARPCRIEAGGEARRQEEGQFLLASRRDAVDGCEVRRRHSPDGT